MFSFFVQMWPDLIQKSKDGGLDVIETYVFWNLHEPVRGKVIAHLILVFMFVNLSFDKCDSLSLFLFLVVDLALWCFFSGMNHDYP